MKNILLLIFFSIVLIGCASSHLSAKQKAASAKWIRDGSILFSRPLPEERSEPASSNLLGFMQSSALEGTSWVRISHSHDMATLNLMKGAQVMTSIQIQLPHEIDQGSYQVQLKQESPVWHAPDSYFLAREIEVPPLGHASRYLKAAYGQKAVFLDDQFVIHDGQLAYDEVGGIVLSSEDLDRLYQHIAVGETVLIEEANKE